MSLQTPVFISYRRDDAANEANSLSQELRSKLNEASVFFDTSSIGLGDAFPDEIQAAIEKSNTVIVVIGPDWLTAADEHGRRRIDLEMDWVRQEVELALRCAKKIVPVLIRGAKMPPAEALPDALRPLPQKQGVEIRRDYWEHDVKILSSKFIEEKPAPQRKLTEKAVIHLIAQKTLCKERDLRFRTPHLVAALIRMIPSFSLSCLGMAKNEYVANLKDLIDRFIANQADHAGEHGFEDFELEDHPIIRSAFSLATDEDAREVDERHVFLAFLHSASSLKQRIQNDLGDPAFEHLVQLVTSNRPGGPEVGGTPFFAGEDRP